MIAVTRKILFGLILMGIVALLVAVNVSADTGAAALHDYEVKVALAQGHPAPSALDVALNAACPSQPGAMTRARCVQWVQVGQCETGGRQHHVTRRSMGQIRWRYSGPGYYDGAVQFDPDTWTSNLNRIPARKLTRYQRSQRHAGRYHHAWSAPPAVQILAAEVLRIRIGGNPAQTAGWPVCGHWF